MKYQDKTPPKSNESIAIAMSLFSIDQSENTRDPDYDPNLEFRGLTTGSFIGNERLVFIGNDAFESWGLLGSTLAHEIEIHAKQSFLKIEFINFIYQSKNSLKIILAKFIPIINISYLENENYGTYLAEKEAYTYEINSQDRFSLTQIESSAIQYILDKKLSQNDS